MSKRNGDESVSPVMSPADETGRSVVGYPHSDAGISLRDYFAAKAMPALVGSRYYLGDPEYPSAETWDELDVSKFAYELADAMLVAREL